MTIDLTVKGKLEVHPFVTEAKYVAMKNLVEGSMVGGHTGKETALAIEGALGTSDAIFSLAHLVNVRNLEDFEKAPRQWTKIASVETVDDFKETTFQTLRANLDPLAHGKGTKGNVVSPTVAEFDTYTYAYGYSEESIKVAIEKRGFKWGLSLEAIINDPRQQIRKLPKDMLDIALDTDEFLVFDALQTRANATSSQKAGVNPITDQAIPANALPSAEAFRLGLSQIQQRTVANRRVALAPSYVAVVGIGWKEIADQSIEDAKNLLQIVDGKLVSRAPSIGNLSKITEVIESEFIESDGRWFLTPAAGTTKRPSLVKLQLAGHTTAEVLVGNFAGIPIGGTSGNLPFEKYANFDNDTVDLKLRQFTNSDMITQDQLVWSSGKGQ